MELPDYFLIDLPEEAELTPTVIAEACRTLKENRARFLAELSTDDIIQTIASLAERWLDDLYPFRVRALETGPRLTGFSEATLKRGLDDFFRQLTTDNLQALVAQDLGHHRRMDGPVASSSEKTRARMAQAIGPALLTHIAGGVIPNTVLSSMILGLLAKSAQFVKCASGTGAIPRLFAHSLYDLAPKLGACLEMAEWPGGSEELEAPVFEESDCVTATGSDETLKAIQSRLNNGARFLGYGHKVSFGFISKEGLTAVNAKTIAANAARDVAAWNQLGCLSPHVLYVEKKGMVSPDHFAGLLAEALAETEQKEPRGSLPDGRAANIANLRSAYELRAAHSNDTLLWASEKSTAWTVVYEDGPLFQPSCLHRFIYVKSVESLEETLSGAEPVREKVSTVGVAVRDDQSTRVARRLAQWGVKRICALGRMQNPHLLWRHDGRPSLGDLVTWSDWELE